MADRKEGELGTAEGLILFVVLIITAGAVANFTYNVERIADALERAHPKETP